MLSGYKDTSIEVDRFKQSKRPIRKDMPYILPKSGTYIPVVRYEGLYYSGKENNEQQEKSYSGKFYFYEPESGFALNLGNYLLVANKYHAMRYFEERMLGEFNEIELLRNGSVPNILSLNYLFHAANAKYFITSKTIPEGLFNDDFSNFIMDLLANVDEKELILLYLLRTKQELTKIMQTEEDIGKHTFDILTLVKYDAAGKSYHVGENNFLENYNGNMFAKADYLDQHLVVLARKFGYDSIILQREVGEFNILTEIVDCREDINNISKIYPDNKAYSYPLIWTPNKGLLQI